MARDLGFEPDGASALTPRAVLLAIGRIKDKLLRSLERGDAAMRIATRSFDDGSVGYVLYVQR